MTPITQNKLFLCYRCHLRPWMNDLCLRPWVNDLCLRPWVNHLCLWPW